jgi:SAM-dependent methyltransferase
MPFSLRSRPRSRPAAPPDALLAGVGTGDYFETGERVTALLGKLAGLRRNDRVLDVGCGLGRLAWPISESLSGRGTYDGLDTVQLYVDWCRGNLGLDPARFRFHHADVQSSLYNTTGSVAADGYRFPWPDACFDLAIATSLFTHLLPNAAERYLQEIGRTLASRGRLFASFFILDEQGLAAVATGLTTPRLAVEIEHGRVDDAAIPEGAVGLDGRWLEDAFDRAGLDVTATRAGYWKGPPGLEYQDVVVARRR